jgi:hypothetical protein
MEKETEATTQEPSAESGKKISRKSLLGVIVLALFLMLATTSSDEESPAWARELPRQISPPLDVPLSPAGPTTVSGVVQNSAEHAVRDALVSSGSGALLAWDYSDADGRFTLEGLPSGDITLRVIGDGHEPEEFTVSSSEPQMVLTLSTSFPTPPSLPELTRVDVTGVVSAPRSRWGVEGYELWLAPLSPAHEFGAPLARRATVQADRSVSLDGLLAGRYQAALLPPWAQAGTWPNLLNPETPILSIGLSETNHLELEMVAGEIEGTVIDDRGKLVAKAIVSVYPEERPSWVWPQARTDARGQFVLRDLPVGKYVLHAHAGELSVEHPIQMPGSSTLKVDLSLRR